MSGAKAPRTITRTTPLGRPVVTTLDATGRVGQIAVPGVLPVTLAYDVHARLETVTQGTRTLTRTYGPDGFTGSITDLLTQLHLVDMDVVGRMLSETRPDSEQVLYGYDAVGNQASVTPPGQPGHLLGYTPVDRLESYDPPALPVGPTPTSWSYDDDRKLETITKPGGVLVSFGYDAAGRPESGTTTERRQQRTLEPFTEGRKNRSHLPILPWNAATHPIPSA